jgi:hypothetical protein
MRNIGKSGDRWLMRGAASRKPLETEIPSGVFSRSPDTLGPMGVRAAALVALLALAPGCFGYNRSAKNWAYAGNTVLIVAGGAVITYDVALASGPEAGMTTTAAELYDPPLSGVLLTGIVLAAAGVFGMIFNATRPTVKTSR